MKAVVFSATYRPGGLDVLEASMARQTNRDFVWVICDELWNTRWRDWSNIEDRTGVPMIFIHPTIKEGNKRNLCSAYNEAAELAVENNFDLFISLQDYIYVPEDGIQRFMDLLPDVPNDLYTGVTHISMDPFPTKILDLNGTYSIFKEPFYDKPKRILWEDVRVAEIYKGFTPGDILGVEVGHWEANWAAVPVNLLRQGARWDETYDRGIAYENMDFAKRCHRDFHSVVWLDTGNVAISLPHKTYWEGEEQEILDYSNRSFYEEKWSNR